MVKVRISESKARPHPADGMTAHVDLGDGASSRILNPQSFEDGGLCWSLTWWDSAEPLRYVASSVIEDYDYLLSGAITTSEAIRRLRILRSARRSEERRGGKEWGSTCRSWGAPYH